MSTETNPPRHLEVVRGKGRSYWHIPHGACSTHIQESLFPLHGRAMLVVMSPSEGSEEDFLSVIRSARPKFVVDIRRAPRFDLGRLNRRTALNSFAEVNALYKDLSGRMSAEESELVGEVGKRLLELFGDQWKTSHREVDSIVLLVEGRERRESLAIQLPRIFSDRSGEEWEVYRFPT